MQLERLFSDKPIPYVPNFGGERAKARENPDYRPAIFHLLPMTVAQFEESGDLLREVDGESGLVRFRVRPEKEEDILSRHVARIENLSFSDGRAIADGKAFVAARTGVSGALAPLYMEILAAVRDISVLREGERKN